MARVSVVIAAKDAAGAIEETLASVLAQTWTDWELVVVDDGSADGTAQVAARVVGDRGRVLSSAHAEGPGAARNRGVAAAGGELVAFLDADDTWDAGYLQAQVERHDRAVAAGRRVGIVACDVRLLGPAGPEPETFARRVGRPPEVDLRVLLHHNMFQTPAVLMPRGVLEAVGGFDPELMRGEDYDLWLRVTEAGYELVVAPEALVTVRLRPDGLSADTARLAADTRAVYDRALARGRLTPAQRRLARRQRRLQRVVERRALAATGRPSLTRRAATVSLAALVALEHPERWLQWLRRGIRAAGPGRHA